MRKIAILGLLIGALLGNGLSPVQGATYPYSVGLPCATERSTVPDQLKNPMICTKIGSVKIWRANSKGAFALTHAMAGEVYMQPVTAHFKPSLTLKSGTFKFSLASKAGTPPVGIKLNNAGILSGIPTKAASSRFTVCAMDTRGKKDCRYFSLTVDTAVVTGTWEGTFTLNDETMVNATNFCGNTHQGKFVMYIRQQGATFVGEQIFYSVTSQNTFNKAPLDCLPGFSDVNYHSISGTVDSNLNMTFSNFMGYDKFATSAASKVMNVEATGTFTPGDGIIILQTTPASSEKVIGPITTIVNLTFNVRKTSNWGSMVPQVTPPG